MWFSPPKLTAKSIFSGNNLKNLIIFAGILGIALIFLSSFMGKKTEGRIYRSQWSMIWRRFCKNKLAMAGMVVFILLVLVAIFADIIADYDTMVVRQNMQERFLPPNSQHWFGTDDYGRDIFARIIHGTRISLFVGIVSILISLIIGSVIGATAGYYGGKVDNLLMRIMDVFLAIPSTLLAISIVAALGQGMANLMIAMCISQVPRFSRIVRSSILTVKDQEFIEAARCFGSGDRWIIMRHILPNALGPIIVQSTLNVARMILTISGLSFVGLGISPPTPEWGSMLAAARPNMRYYPYLVIFPGIAIAITVLALNLIGDGLRDALDPKMKN